MNAVGVDVNTASAPLLTRVSGIGEGLADEHRGAPRRQRPVPHRARRSRRCRGSGRRRSSSAPASCASRDGDDPLDASSVHPEAYPVVRRIIAATGTDLATLIGNARGRCARSSRPSSSTTRSACRPSPTSCGAGEAGPRPATGVQDRDLRRRRGEARRPAPGHGAGGRGHQRRRVRRVRRHRRAPGRPGARLGDVEHLRQGPARRGEARRRREGQGARRRHPAQADLADPAAGRRSHRRGRKIAGRS